MSRLVLVILLAVLLCPQTTRDFLTADEIDQVRLTAQDPNARLNLYAGFARQRAELIRQLVAVDKPGRSAMIHQTIEDFTRIIETIDIVADDALKKNQTIDEGMAAVATAEKEVLGVLSKIQESNPKDVARYRFALVTAIEATQDSLELAQEDLTTRKRSAETKASEEKKQRETMMTPDEVKVRREASQKQAETETKQKKKAPTLRRPGDASPKQP